jgi:hypothetical protein
VLSLVSDLGFIPALDTALAVWYTIDGGTMPTTKAPPKTAKSLADYTLSDENVAIICMAINHFGNGAHPYADKPNLPYFMADYTTKCLHKLKKSDKVNDAGKAAAEAALDVLYNV